MAAAGLPASMLASTGPCGPAHFIITDKDFAPDEVASKA